EVVGGVHAVRVDAAPAQRAEHGLARHQGYLALGRDAAHEHGDAPEVGGLVDHVALAHARSPTMRTSGTRRTPCFASTRSTTRSMSASISAAVAVPVLTMKLACIGE